MGRITRRPRAREDLIELWQYIADSSETAADDTLDRIEAALQMLSNRPLAGRPRPEIGPELRSFPTGSYVMFYRPIEDGVELIRVLSHYRDTTPEHLFD